MHFCVVAITLFALLFAFTNAISYRCENNQVLIVQSFGNDTIRMHCQKLNLCGYQNLICNYDREQPSCGGKNNFVSHVNQITPTGPVSHVCCELQHNSALHVPNHDGNDCFVYELPDGSSKDSTKGRTRKQHSIADDEQLTVLQNAAQIPEQIDGITGYRMKLFMLRNKSPPSLIVKAIERLPDGYRVTICRPRCGNFVKEGEIGRNEKTVKAPIINIGGDIMHGKVQSPAEWAAASWSAWSSSSWTSWSSSKLIGETSAEAKARGQIRGDRNKIEEAPNGGEDKRWGSGWNSGKSEGSGWPTGSITNNVNVHANGGSGGLGGVGGEGQGGAVNGVHGGNAGAVAVANGSGAGVGVVAIDGGGDGGFGKAGAGKKGNAGGNGNAGGEGGANSGLGGGNNGNGSEGPDGGDTGKSKAGGKTPNGDGTGEGDNGNGKGNNNGSGDGGDGSDKNGNGKKPNGNGNGNGAGNSSESGASGSGPNGNNKNGNGNGNGNGSSESSSSPDGSDGDGKNKGGKGNGGNGKEGGDKATMIMEPEGGVEAINKSDEEDRTPQGSKAGNGNGNGDENGNGKGDGNGDNEEGSNKNGDGKSPNGSGLGDGDGTGNNGGGGPVKVISGPSHLSSEKPDGDGNGGDKDGEKSNGDGNDKNNGDEDGNNNSKEGGDGNKGNNNSGGNGNGSGENGGSDRNNGNPDGGDASGKSGEGKNGGANGKGDGTNAGGDGNKPDGGLTGAGAGGPDGNGDKTGSGSDGNGKGDGDGSPDGTDGNNVNGGASGENAGGDGKEESNAVFGDKNGSDEMDGSGEGSGADVTSAEFENGAGKNPARPAGGSGEGGDGNGGAGGNTGGGDGSKGTGTEGGAGNGNNGENAGNGGKITPAEEDGDGGAVGGGGGGNAGIAAADPGVGGAGGGGVGAAPAPAAGFGGLGGGLMSCFSGDMEVTTVTGTKRMDELEIGDLVLVPASGNLLKYEKVEMFYHREPETTARFVQINTESGKTLTLTSLHLLPFDDCDILNEAHLNIEDIDTFMRQSKFAHKATPGQCVISLTPSGTLSIDRILSINRRVSKGIYSPMTVEGSIIANGILSSCFSQLESHAVQKLAYDALVGIYNAFGYLQDAIVEPTQEIPSMLNYIHQLSRFVLPFSKY